MDMRRLSAYPIYINEGIIIDKEYFKFYNYKQSSNIQQIGVGGFEKVFRANWKNSISQQYFALKYFFNLDNVTVREIVRERSLRRV
ncbi:hypothetical protein C1645_878239 [Glomus cerebriforme]|uniref:Protein kinase domain-containing protein n=1 Tax=Glomus cerebriforme TaxID=658196 RepID=A0A397SQE1_9GLOM|nr:hypothetical protein C1645_878239 [Glomus cerebriforme]